ncbi:alpha-2A adrenergic receptor-like [Saccostrea cucullata]|uniref:alpha-2A adrenergic receptor-like n=1 Tax=Saccostrea cuccullata TaxID=36930 RepID=UPI002ED53A64
MEVTVKNILITLTLSIIVLVTIVGNFLVMLSFALDSRLRQPFNYFIVNLAVTDFLVALFAMSFYTIDTLLGYWPFGTIICGFWIYVDYAMTFASVFTIVAISLDRFWSVTWAMQYKQINGKRKNIIILTIVWVCVFIIWTPPFIGDRLKHQEVNKCIWEPSDNREFIIVVDIIGHYIPCLLIVVAYLKVYLVMKNRSKKVGHRGSGPTTINVKPSTHLMVDCTTRDRSLLTEPTLSIISTTPPPSSWASSTSSDKAVTVKSSNHGNREHRIFRTLTYVITSYLICWFPFYVAWDIYAWEPALVPDWLYTFFFWMTYINSTLNPVLYAYSNKDFLRAFKTVIKCSSKHNKY